MAFVLVPASRVLSELLPSLPSTKNSDVKEQNKICFFLPEFLLTMGFVIATKSKPEELHRWENVTSFFTCPKGGD